MIASPAEKSRCRCGFGKGHAQIHEKHRYSVWGWAALLTGITAKPIAITYQCAQCGDIVDHTDDPEILNRNRR